MFVCECEKCDRIHSIESQGQLTHMMSMMRRPAGQFGGALLLPLPLRRGGGAIL